MPASLVDLSSVTLDETATKYLSTRKENTRKAYDKCLKRFTKYYGKPFKDFLEYIETEKKANLDRPIYEKLRVGEDVIRGFIEWHKEAGYANYSTLQSLGAIQNILKYYGVTVGFEFIETPPARPKRENEKHPWTLDEVRQFVEVAEYLRDKTYILFAFQSGISISDILALNYGDIQREYEAGVCPLSIRGFREKTNVPLRTFIGRDTLYYLRIYLDTRPNIQPEDPIFVLLGTNERGTPGSIQAKLRDYAAKLDFIYEEDLENGYSPVRPHSLRSGFRSSMTDAKMDGDLIEYFMSHQQGQEKSTYMNQTLEQLRQTYSDYEQYISIYKTSRQEREEQSRDTIPDAAMNVIRDQGQRIAELETRLSQNREDIQALSDAVKRLMERKEREP